MIKIMAHKISQVKDRISEIENLHLTSLMLDACEYNVGNTDDNTKSLNFIQKEIKFAQEAN